MDIFIRNRNRYNPKTKDIEMVSVHVANYAGTFIWQIKEELKKILKGAHLDELFYFTEQNGMQRLEDGRSVAYYNMQQDDILETTSNPFFVAAMYILHCDAERKQAVCGDDRKFYEVMEKSKIHKLSIIKVLFNSDKEYGAKQPPNFRTVDDFINFVHGHNKKGVQMSVFTEQALWKFYNELINIDMEKQDFIGSFVRRYSAALGFSNGGIQEPDEEFAFLRNPGTQQTALNINDPQQGLVIPLPPHQRDIYATATANYNRPQANAIVTVNRRGRARGRNRGRVATRNVTSTVTRQVASHVGHIGGFEGGHGYVGHDDFTPPTGRISRPTGHMGRVGITAGRGYSGGDGFASASTGGISRSRGGFVGGHGYVGGGGFTGGGAIIPNVNQEDRTYYGGGAEEQGGVVVRGGTNNRDHSGSANGRGRNPRNPQNERGKAKKKISRACENCVVGFEATVYCAQCEGGMALCAHCDTFSHQAAARSAHLRVPIGEAPKQPKLYTPKAYMAPFALLLGLYEGHRRIPRQLSMSNEDLKLVAQTLTDTDLSAKNNKIIGGFDGAMENLLAKDLVQRESDTPTYTLRDLGIALARRLLAFHQQCFRFLEEAQVPSLPNMQNQENVFSVGTRRLCLVVDRQEKQTDRLVAMARELGLSCQVRDLPVGDYLWILLPPGAKADYDLVKPNVELVLPTIVERKSWDDLSSSTRDGRFLRQLKAIKKCEFLNKFYLVEGSISDMRFHKADDQLKNFLKECLLDVLALEEFHVTYTSSWYKTVHWLTWLSFIMAQQYSLERPKHLITYQELLIRSKNKEAAIPSISRETSFHVWSPEQFIGHLFSSPDMSEVTENMRKSLELKQPHEKGKRKLLILQGLEAYNKGRSKLLNDCLASVVNEPESVPEEVVESKLLPHLRELVHYDVHMYHAATLQIMYGVYVYRTENAEDTDKVNQAFQIAAANAQDQSATHLKTPRIDQHLLPVGTSEKQENDSISSIKDDPLAFAVDSQGEAEMMNEVLKMSMAEAGETVDGEDDILKKVMEQSLVEAQSSNMCPVQAAHSSGNLRDAATQDDSQEDPLIREVIQRSIMDAGQKINNLQSDNTAPVTIEDSQDEELQTAIVQSLNEAENLDEPIAIVDSQEEEFMKDVDRASANINASSKKESKGRASEELDLARIDTGDLGDSQDESLKMAIQESLKVNRTESFENTFSEDLKVDDVEHHLLDNDSQSVASSHKGDLCDAMNENEADMLDTDLINSQPRRAEVGSEIDSPFKLSNGDRKKSAASKASSGIPMEVVQPYSQDLFSDDENDVEDIQRSSDWSGYDKLPDIKLDPDFLEQQKKLLNQVSSSKSIIKEEPKENDSILFGTDLNSAGIKLDESFLKEQKELLAKIKTESPRKLGKAAHTSIHMDIDANNETLIPSENKSVMDEIGIELDPEIIKEQERIMQQIKSSTPVKMNTKAHSLTEDSQFDLSDESEQENTPPQLEDLATQLGLDPGFVATQKSMYEQFSSGKRKRSVSNDDSNSKKSKTSTATSTSSMSNQLDDYKELQKQRYSQLKGQSSSSRVSRNIFPGTSGLSGGSSATRLGTRPESAVKPMSRHSAATATYVPRVSQGLYTDHRPGVSAKVATITPTQRALVKSGSPGSGMSKLDALVLSDDEDDKAAVSKSFQNTTCGNCGGKGHNRKSRDCPEYNAPEEAARRQAQADAMKQKKEDERRSKEETVQELTQQRNMLANSLHHLQDRLQNFDRIVNKLQGVKERRGGRRGGGRGRGNNV